mgnify:CR=1 FL=1
MSFYLTVGTHGQYDSDRFSRFFEQYEKNVKETDYVNWMKQQGFVFPEDEECCMANHTTYKQLERYHMCE